MIARAVFLALALVGLPGLAESADPKAPAPATAPPPPVLPGLHPPMPPAPPPAMSGELDCRGCHQREHGGIVRMYLGTGGRGTPRMPSHMAELRVECVACHVEPKEVPGAAQIVGQTFKVGEKACLECHGEQYRGMMTRWTTTLAKMREIVDGKLAAARAAVNAAPQSPKLARLKKLLDDAEYNSRFVKLGRGAHNPFYAADLLKLANVWADDVLAAVGKPPAKVDDALVRGGYCAVLCHEQAAVKLPATVAFGKQKVPHARHVTEFGATCTACHSAETHKAVTAKPADCASCHHSPANERCESCHKPQSAFYRGAVDTKLVKVEPNSMVNAVSCAGCHDMARKHSRAAVGGKCLGCHDKSYEGFATEWTTGLDADVKKTTAAVRDAETAVQKARRAGKKTPEADALLKEARDALALVTRARGAHNPPAAEALLAAAREKAAAATRAASP
ncbi:MAG: hypothetical protein HYR51_19265 [Candidatus Rokubacteria bacterium]|nr:hypothetical protein [Candidatus Rokubacteria bacterium]